MRSALTPMAVDDVGPRQLRDRDQAGDLPRHAHLHPGEAVPAAAHDPLPEVAGVGQLQLAVDDDGVVDGGDQRRAGTLQVEQAVAQALVVVDDVEVLPARAQQARGARRLKRPAARGSRRCP